jgi:hypothetical protein
MTTAFFPAPEAPPTARRSRSMWRQFLDAGIAGETQQAEREIAQYLKRHQCDFASAGVD